MAIVMRPQDRRKRPNDPYAQERLSHAVRFAQRNGQAVVIDRDGEMRLEPAEPPLPPFTPDYKGWVYVIKVRGFDLLKIGYSTDPERRLAELAGGSGMGDGLELLLYFPGDGHVERELHRRFGADRQFGEWFRLSEALREWLGETAAALLVT